MTLWIAGQYRSGEWPNMVWELIGVFDSKDKAVAACEDDNSFVGLMKLNEIGPREPTPIEQAEWPLAGVA